MAEMADPATAPAHVDQVAGALSATIGANSGQDFTPRRDGPGGRKSEFAAGAARGIITSRQTGIIEKTGNTLGKIFAGATSVE